jgi:hypothetical protein
VPCSATQTELADLAPVEPQLDDVTSLQVSVHAQHTRAPGTTSSDCSLVHPDARAAITPHTRHAVLRFVVNILQRPPPPLLFQHTYTHTHTHAQDELLLGAATEFAIYNAHRQLVTGRPPNRAVHAPARRIARTLVCLGRQVRWLACACAERSRLPVCRCRARVCAHPRPCS